MLIYLVWRLDLVTLVLITVVLVVLVLLVELTSSKTFRERL